MVGRVRHNLFTAVSAVKPDGTFSAEGDGLIIRKDGETFTVKVYAIGSQTWQRWAAKVRGAAFVQSASPKLAQTTKVPLIFEDDIAETGTTASRCGGGSRGPRFA